VVVVFAREVTPALVALASHHLGLPALAAGGAVVLACAFLSFRPMDEQMRQRAIDMRARIDLELYQWLLTSTESGALFVTDISTNAAHDTAAMAVLAAGREKKFSVPCRQTHPRPAAPQRSPPKLGDRM